MRERERERLSFITKHEHEEPRLPGAVVRRFAYWFVPANEALLLQGLLVTVHSLHQGHDVAHLEGRGNVTLNI